MHESIIDRIEHLERSNRFWKTTALVLAVVLLSLVGAGLTFFALAQQRAVHAMEAMRAAQQQELAARAAAEAARARAEQALQQQRIKKE